jgi:acetyltransferase
MNALPAGAGWRGAFAPRPVAHELLTLGDGRQALLRPVHPRDAGAEQAFVQRLSPRSRLLRFHGAINQLPDTVLRAMTAIDPARHHALVADAVGETVAEGQDGPARLVADARYAIADGRAEFAIAVADDWRRLGLARALLLRLAAHAQRRGITRLEGDVLAGNEPMLALMQDLGAALRYTGGDAVQARLDLGLPLRLAA